MIKKITWLSWVALGLMVLCVLFTVLILTQTIASPVSKKVIDYESIFILPMAILSCIGFTLFLVKARKMSPFDKRPWVSFSVASYLYFVSITLELVRYALFNINVNLFSKILPDYLGSICLIAAVIAIFFGFYAEGRTTAKNLSLTGYIGIFILLYISTSIIEHFLPIGAILRVAITYALPAVFCIYILNNIGNEPKALCYKVLFAGFIVSAIMNSSLYVANINIDEPLWTIVNLFCVIVATDIRTNIWLIEQK